jgi:ABC-type dipeptide/oligopeptide/nickel transport system ATPase component
MMSNAKKGVPPSTFSEYKIILDLPSKAPSQQFRDYARAFKEVIEVSDPQFALGIFGGWGSGKTTLMNAIEDQLDKDQIITAQFNAWRYEKEQDLIVPLLDVIREALIQWYNDKPDARETAQKVASTIGDVAASLVAGIGIKIGLPLIGEISISGDKAITQAAKRGRKAAEDTEPRSLYPRSMPSRVGSHRPRIDEAVL